MRILLDTNVLIAAFIGRGICHQLFEDCLRDHDLVTSEFILDELREKLTARFRFSAQTADAAVSLIRSNSAVVEWSPLSEPVCRDPDDDAILATAAAGECDRIVTGDKDLLVLVQYDRIAIVCPADFMRGYGGEGS